MKVFAFALGAALMAALVVVRLVEGQPPPFTPPTWRHPGEVHTLPQAGEVPCLPDVL